MIISAHDLKHDACIGLGSNLGDRHAAIKTAIAHINDDEQTAVIAIATVIETPPLPAPGVETGGHYLNTVIRVRTSRTPQSLLELCLNIERSMGRERREGQRWTPRTIDLDILLYDNLVIDEPDLHIPHPRLAERRFVLEPLAEIAPNRTVPARGNQIPGQTVKSLYEQCQRQNPTTKPAEHAKP